MEEVLEIQETQQQEPDPPIKKLYKGLYADKKYTKSFDEFRKQYSTQEAIDKLYNGLKEDGDYTKDKNEFQKQYFQDIPTLKKKVDTVVSKAGGEIGGVVGNSKAQSGTSIDPLQNQKKVFSGLNKAPTDDFTKLESTATISKKPLERTGGVIGIEEIMAQQRSDLGKPLATDNNVVQLPPTQMEINDRLLRQKQYKKNVEIAIDNTTKEYFRLKGIKAREGSSIYQEQKQKIQEKFEDGDVAYHMDLKTNTPRLDRITGWWENLSKGWNEANASNDEAAAFVHDMNTAQRLEYIKSKQLDQQSKPPTEYLSEGQSGLGWAGHTLGGAAPFLGKAAAGAAIGTMAVAAAPVSFGSSLAGLPIAASFLFTAPDAANAGSMHETIRRFDIIKRENPEMSDMDAMTQAESGILAGGIGGIAENALFMGTMKLPLSAEGKQVIGKFATETLQSGLNMGGATALADVAQKLEGSLEGYKTTPKEVAESAVNTFVDNATIGMALHGMIQGAKMLPKAVNSAFKFALKDVPPKDIAEILQLNVESGSITPEQAQKTLMDIEGYKEALDKINPKGLSETSQASIAGLIQAKENLKKEAETKDESVRKPYDEKIEAINQQIADIQRTNKPFEHEVDDVTGNTFSKPTFDEVAKQRVEDIADKISKGKSIEDVVDVQTQAKFPDQLEKQLNKILREEKSANKDKENPNNEISNNITKFLEQNKKEEVDTELSEPVKGLDEQGIPTGKDVPPPTEQSGKDVVKREALQGTVTIPIKVDGKDMDVKYVDEYKGKKIVEVDGNIHVYDPKAETLFMVALDDSKSSGRKEIIKESDNLETAKQYIDWTESAKKENKFVKPIEVKGKDVVVDEGFENYIPNEIKKPIKPSYEEISKAFNIKEFDREDPFWQPTEKKATEVIDWLKESKYTTEYEKELLNKYKNHIEDGLSISFDPSLPVNKGGGVVYNSKGKFVELRINPHNITHPGTTTTVQGTILHELTHFLVKKGERQLYDKVVPLFDLVDKYISENKKELVEQYGNEHLITYGLSGINEFVAESMSNRQFQSILSKINYKGESKSVWQKFTDTIKEYFSKLLGTNDSSVLNEVVKSITQHISENNPLKKEKSLSTKPEIKNEEAKEVTQDTKSTTETVSEQPLVADIAPESKEVEAAEPFVEEKRTILSHRGLQEVATEFGFGDVTSRELKTDPQLFKDAQNKVDGWVEKGEYPQQVNKLVEKSESGEILTDEQRVILQQHISNVRGEMSSMDINTSEYNTKLTELNRLIRAGEATRSAAGAALRVPFMASVPNDLPTMLVQEMNISKVPELTEQQKAVVQKEYKDISEAEKAYQQKIDGLEAQLAKERAERKIKGSKTPTPTGKKTKEDFIKEREDIKKSIVDKWNKAKNVGIIADPKKDLLMELAPDVVKLVKSYAEEGILKLEEITKKIFDDLKDNIKDLTEKDIHNIIAGDYNKKLPTKNQLAEQVENIRLEANLINKLEALMRGEEPKNEKKKIQRNAEIEELRQKIKSFGKEEKTPDQKSLDALKTKLKNESEKIKEQIRTGNYDKEPPKQPLKLDAEALKLRDDLIKLRQNREVRMLLAQRINEKPKEKGMRLAAEVLNIPRTLMTIGDFSGLLRQDIFFAAGHPLRTMAATKEMFKSGWSQTHYDRWFADLKEDPRYDTMQKSRLSISDSLNHDLTKREEDFMSSLSEKIPFIGKTVVRGSERSYTALLNKSRVDMFNYFANSMEQRGLTFENSPKQYKAMAEYINNATGRSDFGETLNRVAPILNSVFFSPRLIASRVNMLSYWAQPRFWKTLPKEVKVDYFRNWISLLAVGGTLMAVAKAGGADVEDDPRSSDFGKIKSGNTRWDIWGGAQPYVRVISQIATGKRKSTRSGKIYELNGDDIFGETRAGVGADFFRNKLAPVPGAFIDILSGRTGIGDRIVYQWGGAGEKEISLDQYVKQRILPMTITGTQEAMKDAGVKALFTVGLPSTFGVGTQTYETKPMTGKKEKKAAKKKQPKKQQ